MQTISYLANLFQDLQLFVFFSLACNLCHKHTVFEIQWITVTVWIGHVLQTCLHINLSLYFKTLICFVTSIKTISKIMKAVTVL
jgi:hypothetical protein